MGNPSMDYKDTNTVTIILGGKDAKFFNDILDNPPEPTQKLIDLMRNHATVTNDRFEN